MFRADTLASALKLVTPDGDVRKLNKLLASKPNVAVETNKVGNTLLHVACHHGRLDMCIVLLLRGADINQADNQGFTPLMVSVQFGNSECAKMLIAKGASVSLKNQKGQTALHIACIFGCSDAVLPLLDFGADLNEPENNGASPIMLAAARSHNTIVALLLEKNADLLREDNANSTALSLARENGLDLNLLSAIVFNREIQLQDARKSPQEVQHPQSKLHSENVAASATAAIIAANAALRQDPITIAPINEKKQKIKKTKEEKESKKKKMSVHGEPSLVLVREVEPKTGLNPTKGVTFDIDAIDKGAAERAKSRSTKALEELTKHEQQAARERRALEEEERQYVEKEYNTILEKKGWVPADGQVPMHPLNESEGNLAAIMLELNIDQEDMQVAGLNADKDMTSLATLEMERRMRLMGLNEASETDKLANGKNSDSGGIAQDFEGSAVSSLTMNSLSSFVIQKKRKKERELLKKSRALMGQNEGTLNCLNLTNCLEDDSMGDHKSPTDILLLKKAEEANGGSAHYLRRLAAEEQLKAAKERSEKQKKSENGNSGGETGPKNTQSKRTSSLDFLWCLAPLLEDENEREGGAENEKSAAAKAAIEEAYNGPSLQPGNAAGGREGVRSPRFGTVVNTETRRDMDNHHAVSHKEMLRRIKKIKRKEARDAALTTIMCGVHEERNSSLRTHEIMGGDLVNEQGGCAIA